MILIHFRYSREMRSNENIYLCMCITHNLIHSGYHNRYDSSLSSHYRRDGRRFKITYGSGGVVGFTSIDTITVSCVRIKFSIGQL